MSDVSEHPGCRECRNYSLRGPEYCAFCETDDLRQQLATLTQERDALREAVRKLVEAADQSFGNLAISMDDEILWANIRADAASLLTPSGEAGKGGGV